MLFYLLYYIIFNYINYFVLFYYNIILYCIVSLLVYVYYSMSNLKNLKTLNMSGNNCSEGLPDVFTSMTSLRDLNIGLCKLPTLPEGLVNASTLLVFCLHVYRHASPVAMSC